MDDRENVAQRATQKVLVYSGCNLRRAVDSALADDTERVQDMDDNDTGDGMAGLKFREEGDYEQDNVQDDTDLNPNIFFNVWRDR